MRNILIFLVVSSILLFAVSDQWPSRFLATLLHTSEKEKMPIINWPSGRSWDIQSIDTMKSSRDLAREKLEPALVQMIDQQVSDIASVGANYIAIGTPYDQEFIPMLSTWVAAARRSGLRVWFRGNWSGWEGWFDYPKNVSRADHIRKTVAFISDNSDLFEDGDILSPCPECENGGPGDPRTTNDISGFRQFIISEYLAIQAAFQKNGKKVRANYYSMNADVARLIMDRETTTLLDGIIVVDHYVGSPDQLVNDINELQQGTGANIVLGEFGAPIPEIHGKMTGEEQKQWIGDVLSKLAVLDNVVGVNYWVNSGGTTGIWDQEGKPSVSVPLLERYFKPQILFGEISNEQLQPIQGAKISYHGGEVISESNGYFEAWPNQSAPIELLVSAPGFSDKIVTVSVFDKPVHIRLRENKWLNRLFRNN